MKLITESNPTIHIKLGKQVDFHDEYVDQKDLDDDFEIKSNWNYLQDMERRKETHDIVTFLRVENNYYENQHEFLYEENSRLKTENINLHHKNEIAKEKVEKLSKECCDLYRKLAIAKNNIRELHSELRRYRGLNYVQIDEQPVEVLNEAIFGDA